MNEIINILDQKYNTIKVPRALSNKKNPRNIGAPPTLFIAINTPKNYSNLRKMQRRK
jgi:hypothetical protein